MKIHLEVDIDETAWVHSYAQWWKRPNEPVRDAIFRSIIDMFPNCDSVRNVQLIGDLDNWVVEDSDFKVDLTQAETKVTPDA